MNNIVKKIVYIFIALAALAVLAFLFTKNQRFSVNNPQKTIEILRDLRQLNAELDTSILRSSAGIANDYDSLAQITIKISNLFSGLQEQIFSKEYIKNLDNVKELKILELKIDNKMELVDQFKAKNAIFKNSLAYLPQAYDQIKNYTNLAPPYLKEILEYELIELDTMSAAIFDGLMRYNLPSNNISEESLNTMLIAFADNVIDFKKIFADQSMAVFEKNRVDQHFERVLIFINHASTVLYQKYLIDDAVNKIVSLSITEVTNQLTVLSEDIIHTTVLESNQYQVYLIGYVVFLLLVLLFLSLHLLRSYRHIRIANDTLEIRVGERTKDLQKVLNDLKVSESHLIQSEKMASLGQMVAGVAHEINTPLAYVHSVLETIQTNIVESPLRQFIEESESLIKLMRTKGITQDKLNKQFINTSQSFDELDGEGLLLIEEAGDLLNDGIHGAEQIKELVLNLRNFSRLDRGKMTRFQVEEGINSSLILVNNDIRGRKVIKNFADTPMVNCTASQINQVLLNIINNAIHATNELSGVISITTSIPDPKHIMIQISDNGKGIPLGVQSKIFDPFFTTKDVGKGTGLGLSIAYKIIEEHHGEISIDTSHKEGAHFVIILPIEQPAQPS